MREYVPELATLLYRYADDQDRYLFRVWDTTSVLKCVRGDGFRTEHYPKHSIVPSFDSLFPNLEVAGQALEKHCLSYWGINDNIQLHSALVSCTTSIQWAFFECARRLFNVGKAKKVYITVIKRSSIPPKRYRTAHEIIGQRPYYNKKAYNFAKSACEVVVAGAVKYYDTLRTFPISVKHFLRLPRWMLDQDLFGFKKRWFELLIWNPAIQTSWPAVREILKEKKKQNQVLRARGEDETTLVNAFDQFKF